MKGTEIQEGGTYLTNVDGVKVPVKVCRVHRERNGHMRLLWHCTRVDTGRALPKARESTAIHPRSET